MPPQEAQSPMAMTHLGSGIWSYRRRSTGAILRLTRPATIIRSLWRGEARMSSMPKRDKSLLGMTVLIISIAQQASPNSIGHMALVAPVDGRLQGGGHHPHVA